MDAYGFPGPATRPVPEALWRRTFPEGEASFFRQLGVIMLGPCPSDRQERLAREVLQQFDRLRFLFRYLKAGSAPIEVLWQERHRQVALQLGRSFLAVEPPRVTDLSYLTHDSLQLDIQGEDNRQISVVYGLHPINEPDRSWWQRLAGESPDVVTRWTEICQAAAGVELTRRAVEIVVADPSARQFVSRKFFLLEEPARPSLPAM